MITEINSEREAWDAVKDLADTDQKMVQAKKRVKWTEFIMKRKEAHEYLNARDGAEKLSVEDCKARARISKAFYDAVVEHTKALVEYETLLGERTATEMAHGTWRTLEASRRKT